MRRSPEMPPGPVRPSFRHPRSGSRQRVQKAPRHRCTATRKCTPTRLQPKTTHPRREPHPRLRRPPLTRRPRSGPTDFVGSKADRLLNPYGRRHYRKNYDLREVPIGLGLLVGLVAIGGWVGYKGAHPDPSLLALDVVPAGEQKTTAAPKADDRGPFPELLAADGWKESSVRSFDPDTLYVKINGRAGYYRSFGVQKLYFMTLEKEGDPSTIVDLELYDHGKVDNALGAYNGERGADNSPTVGERGLSHYARNAMYLTAGKFYLRAVGSDESPVILTQLKKVKARFEAEVEGQPLPWSYGLFLGKMGFKPAALAFFPENAFNFGFAKNVNVARQADETELFVVLARDEAAAKALAGRFVAGFVEYGSESAKGWVQDRYIQTMATARSSGRWVFGVRGAPDLKAGQAALRRIETGLEGFAIPAVPSESAPAGADEASADVTEAAPAEAEAESETGGYDEGGDDYDNSEDGER